MLRVPRIGAVIRAAASDFYFNSVRLVAANVAWALVFLAILFLALQVPIALALVPALAVPVAGIHELTTLIVRVEPVSLSDLLQGMRRHLVPALGLGYGSAILAVVLGTNVVVGVESGGVPGWPTAVLAAYGLVALTTFLVAAWPLLADPLRADVPAARRLRLAIAVCLARPGRLGAFAGLVALFLAISLVLFAAIAMVSVSFAALVAARYVLPIADSLEGREASAAS